MVIGISFPLFKENRQSPEFVSKQGASVIAITDNNASPLAEYADYCLFARSDMASFVDSLAAPLSLINALIVAIGLKKKEQIHCTLEKLEKLWDEYQIYENDDRNTALNRD